ncbi:MAG: hypothetical protein ABI646_11290, partial [Acidobacteriota bacterium]
MNINIAIVLVSVFLAACNTDRTVNVNRAGHDVNMNASANAPGVDHNAMGHGSSSNRANMQSSTGAAAAT